MSRSLAETLLGAAVLAVAIFFVVFAYTRSSVATVDGYEITAKFGRIDGLTLGSDVRLAGIKIGTVIDHELNPDTYQAVIRMSLRNDVALPTDSTAAVVSEGLLGGKFIDIEPGGEEEMLKEGGQIEITQSSLLLEQLIGQFAFGTD